MMMRRIIRRETLTLMSTCSHRSVVSSKTPDAGDLSKNWSTFSESAGSPETGNKSNAHEKIKPHTLRPQERISKMGKYHTVDPTIKENYEQQKYEDELRWRESMKNGGGKPVPNPQNVVSGFGMRRRIKMIDQSELKDPKSMQDAFELGQNALRL